MSNLSDAIDRWESWLASAHGVDFDHDTMYAIVTVNEAARLVANPEAIEIEAAERFGVWVRLVNDDRLVTISERFPPGRYLVCPIDPPGDT